MPQLTVLLKLFSIFAVNVSYNNSYRGNLTEVNVLGNNEE